MADFNSIWNLKINEQTSCGNQDHDNTNAMNENVLHIGCPKHKSSLTDLIHSHFNMEMTSSTCEKCLKARF
jgi:hypothetical protein